MTKFCFQRRQTVVTTVWFNADTEQDAWSLALSGEMATEAGDNEIGNKPIFRRLPKQDEFDL